jgi:hypothetical protein
MYVCMLYVCMYVCSPLSPNALKLFASHDDGAGAGAEGGGRGGGVGDGGGVEHEPPPLKCKPSALHVPAC